MNNHKQPLFANLQYCTRCCMPETTEGIEFDELGICQACRSSEEKMHINWAERENKLRTILNEAKKKAGDNYDCLIPISGGKDSTFQLHVLVKVYGMKPLAVTFNHNWFSETGWYNLVNALETFNVDHIMFTPNRGLVNRLAKRSLEVIGDTCWHCHMGVGSFPLKAAVMYQIPLIIWGESIAEDSGRSSYSKQENKDIFNKDLFLQVSAKKDIDQVTCDTISKKDLFPFQNITIDEYEKTGIRGIHLGDYIFWDDERQMEFIRDTYGWKETEMEGTYKRYKSAECIMAGMHDFTCYLKRGYGRGTSHASLDVRNGLLTREEGFMLTHMHDPVRPEVLDYYLKITGLSEAEFYEMMGRHRLSQLQGMDIPVLEKTKKHSEQLVPFYEQCIEKNRQKYDI